MVRLLLCCVVLSGVVIPLEHAIADASEEVIVEVSTTEATPVDMQLIASYFDTLRLSGYIFTRPRPNEIDFTLSAGNIVLPACVTVDAKTDTVYMAVFVGKIPKDHRNAGKVLTSLMEQNFVNNWNKIEWDKDHGDIRVSYTFLTDDGLPYDEFVFIINQMQRSAVTVMDIIHKELKG